PRARGGLLGKEADRAQHEGPAAQLATCPPRHSASSGLPVGSRSVDRSARSSIATSPAALRRKARVPRTASPLDRTPPVPPFSVQATPSSPGAPSFASLSEPEDHTWPARASTKASRVGSHAT